MSGIVQPQLNVVNDNRTILRDFVKVDGGGLFTHTLIDLTDGYLWLETLVPEVVPVAPAGGADELNLTCAARVAYFPNLTDNEAESIVSAQPWHTKFEAAGGGTDFGGLAPVARGADPPGDVVILAAPLPPGHADCDSDGIPDECEIADCPPGDPSCADCNGNGIPDSCDIAGCTPGDCDCQDCNGNGIPDGCEDDCNENGIPDPCEICDGTACDADNNGIPDECAACCDAPGFQTCTNQLPDECEILGGTFHPAATCVECTCIPGDCCDGTSCSFGPDCDCVGRAQHFLPLTACIGSPCATGVCCDDFGGCFVPDPGCPAGQTYVGGADCSVCPLPPDLPCPDPFIASVLPPSGTHDARRPYPQSDDSLSAREGIGSMNIYPGGPEPVVVTLGMDCPGPDACWQLCETGIEQVQGGSPPLAPNAIFSITGIATDVYEILLERPISGGHWTTITYLADSTGNSVVSYASLPADSNADGVSNSVDVTHVIDCCISGICTPPYGVYSCDIDHSGAVGTPDILEVIDLLNGNGLFIPWDGVMLSNNTCLSGGQSGASSQQELTTSSGGALSAAALNQHFADRFVAYLSTGTLADAVTEQDFRLILEALTRWAVDHFSREERETLASRLQDPSLSFESATAAQMVPDIVAALLK